MQKSNLILIKEYCGTDLIRNRFLNEDKILQIADKDGGSIIRTVNREKISCINAYDEVVAQLSPALFLNGFVDENLKQRISLPYKYIRFFLHPDKAQGDLMHGLWHIYTTFARSHPMYAPLESTSHLSVDFAKFDRYLSAGQLEDCYLNISALSDEHFEAIAVGEFNFTRVTYGSLIFTLLQCPADISNLKEIARWHATEAYPFIELFVKRWVNRRGEEHSAGFTCWINPSQITNIQNGGWGTEVMLSSGELYFVGNSIEEILVMVHQKNLKSPIANLPHSLN